MWRKLLVLPVLLAGLIGLSHGQPPGPPGQGGPGGGRFSGGPPDPEQIWNYMGGAGKDSLNLNDPANARTKEMMQRRGTPIPADGVLKKADFVAGAQARMSGSPPAAAPTPGQPVQFQTGGDRGGRRGFDPSTLTDDQLRGYMQRFDTDGDGRISAAEAAVSDRLRDQFNAADTNRDGFMDVAEYRAYMNALFAQRNQGQSPGGMPGQPQPFQPPVPGVPGQPPAPGTSPPAPGQPAADDGRPEVWRYGKLPKMAPPWMLAPSSANSAGLDADRDGQIGLYEWRRAGKRTAEFVEMDLNADGYLTFAEWKTFKERQIEQQKAEDPDAAPAPVVITPGGPSGSDRRNGNPDRDRKDNKDERKSRRGNPFASGSPGKGG